MSGMKGTLTITVHAAYNLKDTATIGKQDPYCKLTIDKSVQKTPVHKDGGRNPVWGQSYLFNLTGAAGEDKLHIAVVEDGAMSDTDIARADIDLKALCSHLGKKKYNCYDRNNFTVMAGEIELSAKFEGTGGPAILSKSAEVAAMEQKMGTTTTTNTTNNQQNMEMEKMRLQMEMMKMQMQQQQMQTQNQYAQPQYNQPTTAQPQFLQPQVIVQQPVKVEVKAQVGNATFQDNWGYCNKCQNLFFNGAGGGRCSQTGGAHTYGGYNYSLSHGSNKPTNGAQEGWRWCNKCHCICFSGLGAGSCAAGGGHDFNGSGQYWGCSEGHTSQSQNGWNWCNKCQCMFFGSMINSTKCPAGGNHNNQGSGNYHIAYVVQASTAQVQQPVQQTVQQTSNATFQSDWRWCKSCDSIHFGGAGGGKCGATGGAHDKSASYDYHIPHSSNPGHKAQENWRWCCKCHCICFGGMGQGSCYAGGGHDFSQSYNYWVGQENHKGTAQDQFNWCCKCMVLHFKGMVHTSRCPATNGQHDGSQSYNYFIYHA